MVTLPEEFVHETRQVLGEERFERYLQSFEEEPPVSIRLNPRKLKGSVADGSPVGDSFPCPSRFTVADGERVPWCEQGYYLPYRPQFTMDPLLHAGCYYVQEASSMFLWHVLKSLECRTESVEFATALDLCAAPGGKSTLLRSLLPEDCELISNEPMRNRFQVLAENVAKWGYPNHHVTNLYPREFVKSKAHFDLILCDVPCSGEGMFRKDPATIAEWSLKKVKQCQSLQREIVGDAWRILNDDGLLIYSTCTLNTKENEENIRYFVEELGAEVLPVETLPEWNITGSLLPGFDQPVYRFIPGFSRGEGLFLCAMRKYTKHRTSNLTKATHCTSTFNPLPSSSVELSYPQAIAYLRGEALVLPADTPKGLVAMTYQGFALGQVKNIGSRANNLYPKAWRIKTTHLPTEPPQVLKKIE